MKQQEFYGVSDDLIELEGDLIDEEYPGERAGFLIYGGGGAVRVEVYYGRNGTWFVAVAPADDGVILPDGFEASIEVEDYSAHLILALPDDAKLEQLSGRRPDGEPIEA